MTFSLSKHFTINLLYKYIFFSDLYLIPFIIACVFGVILLILISVYAIFFRKNIKYAFKKVEDIEDEEDNDDGGGKTGHKNKRSDKNDNDDETTGDGTSATTGTKNKKKNKK